MSESPSPVVCDVPDEPVQAGEAPEQDDEAGPPASLTFGACAERLRALGYAVTTATMMRGAFIEAARLGAPPMVIAQDIPDALLAEQPVAVEGLMLLILQGHADRELERRADQTLARAGMLRGPYRFGSDGRYIYPLRSFGGTILVQPILDGTVRLEQRILPLDGQWPRGSLFETPREDLPQVPENIVEIFRTIEALPYELAIERRPKPKPTRRGWVGG